MLTEDEVVWAFRFLLGRDPESQQTIEAHRSFSNWSSLRSAIQQSDEFKISASGVSFPKKWILAPVFADRRQMWLDLSDRYVSRACLFDSYEPYESEFVKNSLRENDTFVDIGANIGWFTMIASTIVGEGGSIVSFEPRPETASYLRRTVEVNGLSGMITIHEVGLSDQEQQGYINNAVSTDNPGGSFVSNQPCGVNMVSERIALKTLDSFGLAKVDFIKLDVEGSEMRVLRGGMETIRHSYPTFLAEINPKALAQVSGVTPNEFLQFFIAMDYEIQIVDQHLNGQMITSYPENWARDLVNVGMKSRRRA